jgi:tryptophanyl-tRNA synthetase
MRASGKLHLGHYHGVIKNWIELQHEYDCFFFVADLHGLTTHYEDPAIIKASMHDMVIDWLAAGLNPGQATIFVQSHVPQHAELHLNLSMITPLSWLERVPTYKDQQEKLKDKDLGTYGFLGYPLLQSADVLIYRAGLVPVGEDQVPHIELTREIARRFNHIYGREPGYENEAAAAIARMGKKNVKLFNKLQKSYMEQGDQQALEMGKALIESQANLNTEARELLLGFIEGGGKIILPEPEALLTKTPKFPGLDGQKMSKSYDNTITLRDTPTEVDQKVRTMPTDPARVRLTDPGEPTKCPVWDLHKIYSDAGVQDWVQNGCRKASIGCLDCKKPLIDKINAELSPIRELAEELIAKPSVVKNILIEGAERAREVASSTMEDVRDAMGLNY